MNLVRFVRPSCDLRALRAAFVRPSCASCDLRATFVRFVRPSCDLRALRATFVRPSCASCDLRATFVRFVQPSCDLRALRATFGRPSCASCAVSGFFWAAFVAPNLPVRLARPFLAEFAPKTVKNGSCGPTAVVKGFGAFLARILPFAFFWKRPARIGKLDLEMGMN